MDPISAESGSYNYLVCSNPLTNSNNTLGLSPEHSDNPFLNPCLMISKLRPPFAADIR